jgi:hypothetical protein
MKQKGFIEKEELKAKGKQTGRTTRQRFGYPSCSMGSITTNGK